jgi:hypothetical protein
MSRIARLMLIGVVTIGAGSSRPADARGPAEDDLAVVRRAVARLETSPAQPETSPPAAKRPARKAEPQWLRVRITEKDGKSKVSVNLPLALARALGDDIPLDWACRRHDGDEVRRKIRLGDVLASLDSGQDIVQVDSEDGSVRVWVE